MKTHSRLRHGVVAALSVVSVSSVLAQEIPVRRVVLYKNGVGYVERSGDVGSQGSVTLSFRVEEMTDVLKSLSVSASNGSVERVRFSTDQSLEEKLKAFPFRIGPGESMASLLDSLRGERIEASRGSERISGTILSAQSFPATDQSPAREVVTLIEDTSSINSYEIASLGQLRFVSPKLQQQVAEYLRIVAEARNQERRSISIDLTRSGNTNLSARYMTPMPVWKSSYRMIFGKEGKPTLEGWAVVDNTSGEDWNGISLSLISGKPVSFLTNIYPPVNVDRPFVPLPGIGSTAPVTYESDMRVQAAMAPPPPAPAARAESFARKSVAGGIASNLAIGEVAESVAMADEARQSAISSVATGIEAGALFAYYFPDRVNVRKSESVMLPFLQKPVSAQQLLIFTERQPVTNHPMLAFEMTNDSGLTLDGGPVTVFDGGEYAGEALFETTKEGEKRLMSYGIDLGTSLRTEPSSGTRTVQEISMQRGILSVKSKQRSTIKFTASNADSRAKTLIVERLIRPNYEVVSPANPEKTSTANRFRVQIPASGNASLEVVEEYPFHESLQVSNLGEDRILVFTRNQALPAAARQALERILAKKREIADNLREINNVQIRINSLNTQMERVRRNMDSLNRIRGQEAQVQKLAAELGTLQTDAAEREAEIERLRERDATLQQELASMIESTQF
jgi:hypothetical protein